MRPLAPLSLVIALGALPAAAQGLSPGYAAAAQQGDVERLLARADAEEQKLVTELEEARPRLDVTRHRILARGRPTTG